MSSAFSGHAGREAALWDAQQAAVTQAQALAAIQSGQQQQLGALGTGYDAARGAYGDASALYQPYVDAGQKALGVYDDAIGLNGAAGNASATSAFQASPGYQYQVDQATDAVARKASALGALGSGNTQAAIASTASHLADQEYGNWLDRVNGVNQQGYAATGAQAGLTKGIGDLDAAQGAANANVYGQGTQLGVNAIENAGSQTLNAGTQGLLAGQQADANQWGAILGAGQIAAQGLGSALGSGTGKNLLNKWFS